MFVGDTFMPNAFNPVISLETYLIGEIKWLLVTEETP